MITDIYKNELDFVKKLFLEKIKLLNVSGIYIYGSAVDEDCFDKKKSDIDIIVFCSNFDVIDKDVLIGQIYENVHDFKEKRPVFLKDELCSRIEFYINDFSVPIDITVTSKLIPLKESLENDAWYDGFETLMGGVYLNSINIYGEVEDYSEFKEKYYPFYSDDIRNKRLDILSNRIAITSERLEIYVQQRNLCIADHLWKLRKYFIKFLFIYYRKYYNSPEKNIYVQLTKILNLPESEVRILCFLDGDIYEMTDRFINLSRKYINKYRLESKNMLE